MSDDLSGDDQSMIERALKSMRKPNRQITPGEKVKLFLVMVGDELKRTGEVKRKFVDDLLTKLKSARNASPDVAC